MDKKKNKKKSVRNCKVQHFLSLVIIEFTVNTKKKKKIYEKKKLTENVLLWT